MAGRYRLISRICAESLRDLFIRDLFISFGLKQALEWTGLLAGQRLLAHRRFMYTTRDSEQANASHIIDPLNSQHVCTWLQTNEHRYTTSPCSTDTQLALATT